MPPPQARGINARKWCLLRNDTETWVDRAELEELVGSGALEDDCRVGWDGLPGRPFAIRDRDAEYFYIYQGETLAAYSMPELEAAATRGHLQDRATVWGPRLPPDGTSYSVLKRTELLFAPAVSKFVADRGVARQTIVCGKNNVGKSLLLKRIRQHLGARACLLSSNRFYHFDQIGYAQDPAAHYEQRHDLFIQQLYSGINNQETSDVQIQQLIGWMTNAQREQLWRVCSELLGESFRLVRAQEDNELSPHHVEVGDRSLALASSGTRLLLGIVGACMDQATDTLLIDEPEIGLSPTLQRRLGFHLMDPGVRAEYYPHLRSVYIATHSHLFLDRRSINNNFVAERVEQTIRIRQIDTYGSFNDAQFNLLGNDLEALFMPSAILVLEGITDCEFVRQLLRYRLPDKQVAVVNAKGDGGIAEKLRTISDAFGNLQRSPYRDRIFVLLDKTHSVNKGEFEKRGVPIQHINVLNENGMEHYYPTDALARVFSCDAASVVGKMKISGNNVECNGLRLSKTELLDKVVECLGASTRPPPELEEKLFAPLERVLNRDEP
jgi:predicted ATPase